MTALKSLFIITVATGKIFMPGVQPVQNGPDPFTPIRTLSIDYWCDTKDSAGIKAICSIPEGLKSGNAVELAAKPPDSEPESVKPKPVESRVKPLQKVAKQYWGSSETVPEGQPKVRPAEPDTTVKTENEMAHVFWSGSTMESLPEDASAIGVYKLKSASCGSAEITLDTQQNFLPPIELVGIDKGIEVEKTVKIEWKPVPNAAAYLVTVDGYGEKENVHWTTSKDPEKSEKLPETALTDEELKKYIDEGILLPATSTQCTIPAGIFKKTASPTMSLVAFGRDINKNLITTKPASSSVHR